MPRREYPFLPDQYYHFYNRGNNRQTVFFQRENYFYFLRGLKKYVRGKVDILAYCLMPTHYHMLGQVRPGVQTDEVSRMMMRLGVSYTKAINQRFDRTGSLFQGQFQGKPVQTYEHLLNLCLYIHTNPVKDGLVGQPEDWEFSNYLEWINLRKGTLVDRDFIEANFGSTEEYRKLVMDTVQSRRLWLSEEMRAYW